MQQDKVYPDEKYKISMDGFMEMFICTVCPCCGSVENKPIKFLGWGAYPLGGFRFSMKPIKSLAAGYECQKCFTKCVCHSNKRHIKSLIDIEKEQKKDAE